MELDYYKVLELEPTATQADIKKAFRRLSKLHHPDKGGDTEKFKEINTAYQALSDEQKQKAYNARNSQQRSYSVADINIAVSWKFDDIKNGKKLKFTYQRVEICSACSGIGSKNASSVTKCGQCKGAGMHTITVETPFGQMQQTMPCQTCQGTGDFTTDPCTACKGKKMVNISRTLEVTVPPHTINQYVVPNEGHKMLAGTSDLVIAFMLQEPNFRIDFEFLVGEMTIPFFVALLGKDMPLHLGSTTLKVKIPKESQTGNAIKLSNAFCGYTVFITLRVDPPTLKGVEEFILSLIEGQEDIPKIIENVKETLKK